MEGVYKMFKERRTVTPKVAYIGGEPNIWVMPLALEKMGYYVKNCAKEIGWLGTVERIENIFVIHDVFLFHQEVNAATCEISPASMADFITEQIIANPEIGMEIANSLKLWGHSHVNMGVSPSGQDEQQARKFKDGNEYFIRVIANKSGEMEFALFDFLRGITFSDVKWAVYNSYSVELEEAIKTEIAEKVKEKTYTTVKSTSYVNGRQWHGNSYYDDYDTYDNKEWDDKHNCWVEKKTTGTVNEKKEDEYDLDIWLHEPDGTLSMSFILKLFEPELESIAKLTSAYETQQFMNSIFKTSLTYLEFKEILEYVKKHIAEGKNTIYIEGKGEKA
jgi:hypothetical protein